MYLKDVIILRQELTHQKLEFFPEILKSLHFLKEGDDAKANPSMTLL